MTSRERFLKVFRGELPDRAGQWIEGGIFPAGWYPGEPDGPAREFADRYFLAFGSDPVPLAAVTTVERRVGPEFTMRYNLYRSAQITGAAATPPPFFVNRGCGTPVLENGE